MKLAIMKTNLVIVLAIFVFGCNNKSSNSTLKSDSTITAQDTSQKFQMKQYWLVFLYKGAHRNQDSAAAAMIQNAHTKNIERLAKIGKIVLAGPMGYDKDLRGIFIMDCKDSTETAYYIKTDTAIVTGRLRFEIHPWWTAKGKVEFK